MHGKKLIINTLMLSAVSLILRFIGLGFQVYLANRIGKEGIGLFQLVMGVSGFIATLAISGIRFSTTRLVSEEIGKGRFSLIKPLLHRCLIYSVICGTASCLLVFFTAEPIGKYIIGDDRTVLGLRLLGAGLPFLSMGACLSGYFTGSGRVSKGAIGSLSEEIFRVVISALLLSIVKSERVETTVALVIIAGAAAEALSFIVVYVLYVFDSKRFNGNYENPRGLTKRILSISVPLALAAYGRTALTSLQNTIIPRLLRNSGISAEESLSTYGMIQGMVFPILLFPSVIFASVAELIVPEMTIEQVKGNSDNISRAANALLKYCLIFSVAVTGALVTIGDKLGLALYGDKEVGEFVRLFALLMPVMYMDHVTDGMLRGLGEHLYSMRLNIVDSVFSLLFIWLLIPRYAVKGYVTVLYASEILNFTFSILRLMKKAKLSGLVITALRSSIAAIGAANFSSFIFKFIRSNIVSELLIVSFTFIIIYIVLLFGIGMFSDDEIKSIRKRLEKMNIISCIGYIKAEPNKRRI